MTMLVQERSDILRAIYERRAVRTYTDAQPDEDTIRALLDAAVQAPTAMHLEPWAFVVVQDKRMLERLSDRSKRMLLEQMKSGSELTSDPSLKAHVLTMLGDSAFNIFYDAGTLVVICGRQLGPFTQADCWLAAENLMLAACAGGLGTCCIGFALAALNAPDVKEALHIPDDVNAVAPIILGYPSAPIRPVPRKPPRILSWTH